MTVPFCSNVISIFVTVISDTVTIISFSNVRYLTLTVTSPAVAREPSRV